MRQLWVQTLSALDWIRHSLERQELESDKALGALGEDLAHRFLQRNGYTIVARNYRPPNSHREVDIIARHGDTLVIVEVKTRSREDYLPTERAVDKKKRHNLERAAVSYIRRAHIPWERVRFDIVSVVLQPKPLIRHTPDAFHPDRSLFTRPVYATEVQD
jgi:putative endonuclease